jgi:bleomycin hydrolase
MYNQLYKINFMKRVFVVLLAAVSFTTAFAQSDADVADPKAAKLRQQAAGKKMDAERAASNTNFVVEKSALATTVKNQAMTGTCWCFSSISLIESQCLKNNLGEFDLSEMFSVRNIYVEKATNYILRQGHAQFGEGGLGHDLIRAIATYGAVPDSVYSGLKENQLQHNHVKLAGDLKKYLDSILKIKPLPENWIAGYKNILDSALGPVPVKFSYNGKSFTPKTFASEVLKFNAADYVNITSFTHHPFYEPFVLEVPDNFSNGAYYNIPLNEMIQLTKDAVNKGYTVLWDADVSNDGFQQSQGTAVDFENLPAKLKSKDQVSDGTVQGGKADPARRQKLFENLTTQDDHLMHIVGLEKSKSGATFFFVKNSWGDIGPARGYINVSEPYFGINTVSLVVPKAALSKELLEKLKIK